MLLKNSIIYMLASLIPGLLAFIALSLYSHLLTPDEYGIYTLIISASTLLHTVLYNWLPAGTIRFWSSKEYTDISFTSTLAISYIKMSIAFLGIALIGVIYYWGEPAVSWIVSGYLLLLALAIYTITLNLFIAKIEPMKFAYIRIGYSILALVIGTLLAYLGFGATGVLAGITLGALIPALFVFKSTWLPFEKSSFDNALFKRLFTYGLPFASVALLEELTKVTDRFMLAGMQDKAQAGLYAVGYDLAGNTILMIMTALNLASFPVIVKLFENDEKKEAKDHFHHYVILLFGISIPALVGLNLVGPDLIHLVIDEEYQETVTYLLPWISTAVFMMGLQAFYFDIAFQLSKHIIAIVKIGAIVAVVNFVLNYWLIPIIGIQGAAIATLVSFTLATVLSAILGRKYYKIPVPQAEIIKIVISALVMGFCLWWLKDYRGWGWLGLQLGVGILSYFVMMVIFNVLDIRTHLKERLFN